MASVGPMDHLKPGEIRFEGLPYTEDDLLPIRQVQYNTFTTASTNTITFTQDVVWNGWTVGNTTTGTSTYITDEDMVRFEGTGITWDQQYRMIANNDWYSVEQEVVFNRWQVIQEREIPSPEELQRRADEVQRLREAESRARLQREQRRQQIEENRILAEAKGLELLLMVLTDEQRTQYDLNARIPVRGSLGGLYEIDTLYGGVHGNVVQVDEHGCQLGRVCVAPRMRVAGGALPMADGWVGQLMAIKTDEDHFRRTGNWSSVYSCRHPDVPILERAA